MAEFEAQGISSINVIRKDDEERTLELQITCEDDTEVRIYVGRFYDDALTIRDLLRDAAAEFADKELDDWQDVPDNDNDGFVCDAERERGYYVTLSGHFWTDDVLVPHAQARNARTFLTRDIANYELARAMSDQGYFPNCWYQNERGNTEDIGAEVRKYHDEGGDKILPIEGATFADGASVLVDGDSATIIKDYGAMGIVFSYDNAGDDEHTDDRESVVLCVFCKNCDEPIKEDDNGVGGKIWVHFHGSTVCHDDPAGTIEDGDTTTVATPEENNA